MPSAATELRRPLVAGSLSVSLGGAEVLHDIDFHVDPGEFVVLLGGNGSGKTTLVKACLGLLPVTRGEVHLFGVRSDSFTERHRIGYVPQRMSAVSGVPASVFEVVLSGRVSRVGMFRRYSSEDHAAARDALSALDLEDLAGKNVAELSGGQQQRVLIARALAGRPHILVLDEPVASVDLAHQSTFAATLNDLRNAGTAVLMVAHHLGAIEPLVDRSVVLERGVVVHDGAMPPPGLEAHHHHHHDDEHDNARGAGI